jgi:type I restriction enzyme, S subunit
MKGGRTRTDAGIYPRGFSSTQKWPWPLVRSEELVLLNYGKALRDGDRRSGDVPVYGTNGQCGWHDIPLTTGPGVILGRKGQGPLGVEWCDSDFWVIDTAYFVTRRTEQLDLRYFFYFVKYVGLNHLKDGTSNPSLSRATFSDLLVPVPPVRTQRAISDFLTTLDQRIKLSRRLSDTLEAIASAIFKSWFVHGGMCGSSSLDKIANFLNGLALQKFPPTGEDDLPAIKIAELRRGETKESDLASGHIPPEYVVNDGDVLFSWSGSLEVVIWCGGKGALNQHLFKVTSQVYPKWFYYFWLKEHLTEFQAIAASKATTMGHIQRHHLTEALVGVPSDKMLREGDALIAPMLERIVRNNLESRTLVTLRDTLVPRLISGEIRLTEAQKIEAPA